MVLPPSMMKNRRRSNTLTFNFARKKFSTALVECGIFSVDNPEVKNLSTQPVENHRITHIILWMNFRWRSKQKGTYPHKNPLTLQTLP